MVIEPIAATLPPLVPPARVRWITLACLTLLAIDPGETPAQSPPAATTPAAAERVSSTADAIYEAARPRLLQIRTLVQSAGNQSTLGSGFLVSADGFAITNYHVVSQYALEPTTYRLEYAAPDGSKGPLKLRAIDIANDLAVVELDRRNEAFFEFDPRALKAALPKGERLFAMGNPLDLGFTIIEGTYNGLVEKSYSERIHFSGALNPGMSGGPTVTMGGRIAGVNVAKQIGGELVSFLVPAHFAAALLERARANDAMSVERVRDEITRQLTGWQAGLYGAVADMGFRPTVLGPYRVPESSAPWITCWSRTNADATPKPRALVNQTSCSTKNALFIAGDLSTGQIELSQTYVESIDLNAFQFATFLSQQSTPRSLGYAGRKRVTAQKCTEDFVATSVSAEHPLLRVVWCARAYREFEGLYDISVTAVTQDRAREAIVSRLSMRGTMYPNAVALARKFLDGIELAP